MSGVKVSPDEELRQTHVTHTSHLSGSHPSGQAVMAVCFLGLQESTALIKASVDTVQVDLWKCVGKANSSQEPTNPALENEISCYSMHRPSKMDGD